MHYADGSEELYDIESDPNEHQNLIDQEEHARAAARLRQFMPAAPAPLCEGSGARILEKREDGWYWEGKLIDTENPPMDVGDSFSR